MGNYSTSPSTISLPRFASPTSSAVRIPARRRHGDQQTIVSNPNLRDSENTAHTCPHQCAVFRVLDITNACGNDLKIPLSQCSEAPYTTYGSGEGRPGYQLSGVIRINTSQSRSLGADMAVFGPFRRSWRYRLSIDLAAELLAEGGIRWVIGGCSGVFREPHYRSQSRHPVNDIRMLTL